jgi:hypothetical protein
MSPKVRDTLSRPGRTKRGFRQTANFFYLEKDQELCAVDYSIRFADHESLFG